MDYLNKSVAIYGSHPGSSYYVRPQMVSDLPFIDLSYNNNFAFSYIRNEPKKLYEENKKIFEQENDVQKEIETLFLSRNATPCVFLGASSDVILQINQILKLLTGSGLPYNIRIEFCNAEKMSEAYKKWSKQVWTPIVRGFCVPGHNKLIYVLHDSLLNMMLTLGHEIGHILTAPRQNRITEEAKAYSFEIMWLSRMKDNNILELGHIIDLSRLGTPAANGIHDVAFRWVNSFLMDGKTAFEIYKDITDGEIVIVE
jgi:hypothetical protein